MEFLVRHIQRTADIAGGFIVGTLVILDHQAYLQLENGTLVPIYDIKTVEVKNGDQWQRLTPADVLRRTAEGWPAYAGLDARMMMGEEENHD
jgi:hypothetical protein